MPQVNVHATELPQTSDFQRRAAATALTKLFRDRYFNICTLDAVAETLGCQARLTGQDYAALRALHCVNWADMGPDLARMARETCLQLLELPPHVVDAAMAGEVPPAPRMRFRLAFWNR